MHKHDNNNNPIIRQARAISRLSQRQRAIVSELIFLYHAKAPDEDIQKFWYTLPERITFDEYLAVVKALGLIEIRDGGNDRIDNR